MAGSSHTVAKILCGITTFTLAILWFLDIEETSFSILWFLMRVPVRGNISPLSLQKRKKPNLRKPKINKKMFRFPLVVERKREERRKGKLARLNPDILILTV